MIFPLNFIVLSLVLKSYNVAMLKNKILILFTVLLASSYIAEAQIKSYGYGGRNSAASGGLGQHTENQWILGVGFFKATDDYGPFLDFSTASENGIYGFVGRTSGRKAWWHVQVMHKNFEERNVILGYSDSSPIVAKLSGNEWNVSFVANRHILGNNYSTFSLYGFAGAGLAFITNNLEENPYEDTEDSVFGSSPLGLGFQVMPATGVRVFIEYDFLIYDSNPANNVSVGINGGPSTQPSGGQEGEQLSMAGLRFGASIFL